MAKQNKYINDALLGLIRTAIHVSNVSVYHYPDNTGCEYTVYTIDGNQIALETKVLVNHQNNTAIQYSIFINDDNICSIIIPKNRKIYLQEEKDILDLFQACSARLIFQEMNASYAMIAGRQNNKIYNC